MITSVIDNLKTLRVSENIAEHDRMFTTAAGLDRYHSVGRSGLRLALTALVARAGYPGGDVPIENILDFGAGYGRVTRFFREQFPSASIDVCDINADALEWCENNLNVRAVRREIPQNYYDLIFLGSVFGHLPIEETAALLQILVKSLRHNGLLLFTAQGRYAYINITENKERSPYNLTPKKCDILVAGYETSGYGFVAHDNAKHGISMIDQSWFRKKMGDRRDIIQIMFQESGYDKTQDCYGYIRHDLMDPKRSGI